MISEFLFGEKIRELEKQRLEAIAVIIERVIEENPDILEPRGYQTILTHII